MVSYSLTSCVSEACSATARCRVSVAVGCALLRAMTCSSTAPPVLHLSVFVVVVLNANRLVGGNVDVVGGATAGEGDVEQFTGRRLRVEDRVRGIHGGALGAVNGRRIAEFDLFAHVPGGKHDRLPVGCAVPPEPAYGEGTVLEPVGDLPPVAVLDPPPVSGGEVAVVVPGDNLVPDPGGGPVVQRHPGGFDGAGGDQVVSGALVQFGHRLRGSGDHDRGQSRGLVVLPGGVGGVRAWCPVSPSWMRSCCT